MKKLPGGAGGGSAIPIRRRRSDPNTLRVTTARKIKCLIY